jgi:hypothetical protein
MESGIFVLCSFCGFESLAAGVARVVIVGANLKAPHKFHSLYNPGKIKNVPPYTQSQHFQSKSP